jgi:hypothetical protein
LSIAGGFSVKRRDDHSFMKKLQNSIKKPSILILVLLAVTATSAFARIGETRQEIDKRYGGGQRSDIQRLEGAETIKYHFNNLEIEVVFHNNESIWEIFHQSPNSAYIKILLKANAGDGQTWHYDGMNHRWERSGGPKCIGYYWPGHEDYFCIENVKACEEMQNSAAGDLNGF